MNVPNPFDYPLFSNQLVGGCFSAIFMFGLVYVWLALAEREKSNHRPSFFAKFLGRKSIKYLFSKSLTDANDEDKEKLNESLTKELHKRGKVENSVLGDVIWTIATILLLVLSGVGTFVFVGTTSSLFVFTAILTCLFLWVNFATPHRRRGKHGKKFVQTLIDRRVSMYDMFQVPLSKLVSKGSQLNRISTAFDNLFEEVNDVRTSILFAPVIGSMPFVLFFSGFIALALTEPQESNMWKSADSNSTDGYWTSMEYFDHAEPNYTVTPWVLEFWNVLTFFLFNYPLYAILLYNCLCYNYGWSLSLYTVFHLLTVVHGGLVHATGRWELVVPEHLLATCTAAITFFTLSGTLWESFLQTVWFLFAKEMTIFLTQNELLSNNIGPLVLAPIALYRLAMQIPKTQTPIKVHRDSGKQESSSHKLVYSKNAKMLRNLLLVQGVVWFVSSTFDFIPCQNYYWNLFYHGVTGHVRIGYTIYTIATTRVYINIAAEKKRAKLLFWNGFLPYVRVVEKGKESEMSPYPKELATSTFFDVNIFAHTFVLFLLSWAALCVGTFYIYHDLFPSEDAFRKLTSLH